MSGQSRRIELLVDLLRTILSEKPIWTHASLVHTALERSKNVQDVQAGAENSTSQSNIKVRAFFRSNFACSYYMCSKHRKPYL
jgi:hypothetical protein